ncbi:MAG: C40 family peptidase [Clostridia bacterium]|nr:C40 family peptidase [Clostridia bacterium]
MSEELYLVQAPSAFLYDEPTEAAGPQTDEVFSGWAVRALESKEDGWVEVQTHYGYRGWIRQEVLIPISKEQLAARDREQLLRVRASWMDIYGEPKVQGRLLASLPRGSFVQRAQEPAQEGWIAVRTANGVEGWVHTLDVADRREGDGFLLQGREDPSWFLHQGQEGLDKAAEEELRAQAAKNAMAYLATPYRWGGKSSQGIDCSGLAFMSWMEAGFLIYRDASIRPEYPIRQIPQDRLQTGDLIFFPGHVAVYLGAGKYIHATAYAKSPWVTVNSLNPEDPEYREDLAQKIEACGSLFA